MWKRRFGTGNWRSETHESDSREMCAIADFSWFSFLLSNQCNWEEHLFPGWGNTSAIHPRRFFLTTMNEHLSCLYLSLWLTEQCASRWVKMTEGRGDKSQLPLDLLPLLSCQSDSLFLIRADERWLRATLFNNTVQMTTCTESIWASETALNTNSCFPWYVAISTWHSGYLGFKIQQWISLMYHSAVLLKSSHFKQLAEVKKSKLNEVKYLGGPLRWREWCYSNN